MVPETGVEPVRDRSRGILSPLRLPIPPLRQNLEAPPRFELGVKDLQSSALPLGYGAVQKISYHSRRQKARAKLTAVVFLYHVSWPPAGGRRHSVPFPFRVRPPQVRRVEACRLKEEAVAGRGLCISKKNINSKSRIIVYLALSGERLIIRYFDKFFILPRHMVLAFISVPDGDKNAFF